MPELYDEQPLNREPPLPQLVSSFLTDSKNGYDRNHGAVLHLSSTTHRVTIDGQVKHPLELSVDELANDFEQHTVVCALQCAGNRRHTMRTSIKEVQGLDWFDGAVMNCSWSGPRVSDILARAGVATVNPSSLDNNDDNDGGDRSGHVAFACTNQPCQEDTWYGSSVPLSRALDRTKDVILALRMNDHPLTPEHGFPVRVVTPGIAGARAVKWVDRITVQTDESENHYQRRDYKVLPPDAVDKESAEPYWASTPAVQDMPVNSVIAVPLSDSTVARTEEGSVVVLGYALPSGEGGPVVSVEVSADGGESWTKAEFIPHQDEGRWSWRLWKAAIRVEPGVGRRLVSRATDAVGNTQAKSSQWNLRGVCYNGYGEASGLEVV